MLTDGLADSRGPSRYTKNQELGLDKFKTMKKAQSGDAKRRVLDFEDLDEAEC